MQVTFRAGNNAPYMQDFSFPLGIPDDVTFDVDWIDELHTRAKLTAPGYGKLGGDEYGNGSLFVIWDQVKSSIKPEEGDAVPEVKRYDPFYISDQGSRCDAMMKDSPDGDYVLYTDAVKMQREAFVEGARWAWGGPEDEASAEAEAARRYREEP